MTFPLAYCPHGYEVQERLRCLYERRARDRIFASMELPSQTRAEFARTHPSGYCSLPDPRERIQFWMDFWHERMAVRDDTIPSAYLSEMDQGLYGGLIGGHVRYLCDPATGWVSSMVPPVLRDWSEFEGRAFDPEHPWFQRYLHQLEVFTQGSRGHIGISHFILISGLNFVFELVGATQTYLDLRDRPAMVRRAMELGWELNVKVQDAFFSNVPLLEGGTCSNMVQWLPGRIVSESVDPFHMTSVHDFQRWGRDNLERVFAHFDGGVMHLHGNGRHLLSAVASVRGLQALCLLDDSGYQAAFDFLPHAQRQTGDLPLIVSVDYARFEEALEARRLPGGVLYRVRGVPTADAANRCMEKVRDYRSAAH